MVRGGVFAAAHVRSLHAASGMGWHSIAALILLDCCSAAVLQGGRKIPGSDAPRQVWDVPSQASTGHAQNACAQPKPAAQAELLVSRACPTAAPSAAGASVSGLLPPPVAGPSCSGGRTTTVVSDTHSTRASWGRLACSRLGVVQAHAHASQPGSARQGSPDGAACRGSGQAQPIHAPVQGPVGCDGGQPPPPAPPCGPTGGLAAGLQGPQPCPACAGMSGRSALPRMWAQDAPRQVGSARLWMGAQDVPRNRNMTRLSCGPPRGGWWQPVCRAHSLVLHARECQVGQRCLECGLKMLHVKSDQHCFGCVLKRFPGTGI